MTGVPAPPRTRSGSAPLYLVPVYVGDPRGPVLLTVSCVAGFARDAGGMCAFCHGDPCAERSGVDSLIHQFYERSPDADTCPVCWGSAS